MDNLQNLLRLASEIPIFGADARILAVLFFALGLLLGVYFPLASWKGFDDNSKMRRHPISESRDKSYPNWKEMKILSGVFVVFVILFFVVWMVLANQPNFSRESMQRLTAGGREPILFSVRLLLSGTIFLALSFVGILGIIFADSDRGKTNAKQPFLGGSPRQHQSSPEKKKTDSD